MILVTGGAGYIGSHTNKALHNAGYDTVVLDNLSKGYENFVKWGNLENYDIGRGKLSVHDTLATRIENVKNTGLVDEIIVEEYLGQKIGDLIKYDIDSFVIGDDWVGKFDHLSRYCNMVYLERTKGISSTQLREETFENYDIGIITDCQNIVKLTELYTVGINDPEIFRITAEV